MGCRSARDQACSRRPANPARLLHSLLLPPFAAPAAFENSCSHFVTADAVLQEGAAGRGGNTGVVHAARVSCEASRWKCSFMLVCLGQPAAVTQHALHIPKQLILLLICQRISCIACIAGRRTLLPPARHVGRCFLTSPGLHSVPAGGRKAAAPVAVQGPPAGGAGALGDAALTCCRPLLTCRGPLLMSGRWRFFRLPQNLCLFACILALPPPTGAAQPSALWTVPTGAAFSTPRPHTFPLCTRLRPGPAARCARCGGCH